MNLGPSEWDRLAELYESAHILPPEQRRDFIHSQTSDESLRAEILSLLAVDTPGEDPLERAAASLLNRPTRTSPAEPRLRSGDVLNNRFHIDRYVGGGGMAEVYAAADKELAEDVAVKLLHPELAAQPAFLDRFRRETRLARRISHPNVARVFDFAQDDRHSYGPHSFLVMELLAGDTLAAYLNQHGPMPPAEALEIAKQLAAGLAAAHDAGVIHRDFKPSNVMLVPEADGRRRAVITDFGLAAPVKAGSSEASVRTTSLLLGTPGYMAPEHWAGRPASKATDIYSFGVLLHELITGRHPNANTDATTPIDAPREWAAVIERCLEMEPTRRWASPLDAVAALNPVHIARREMMRKGAIAAGVGTVSLGAYFSRQYWWRPALPKVTRLLLAQVQNSTGDSRFDAATEILYAQLDQSPQLQLLSRSAQSASLDRMGLKPETKLDAPKLREMAWRNGTPAVAYTSLASVGPDYVVHVKLETLNGRPDAVGASAESSFRASGPQDLFHQLRSAASWIRAQAGEAASQIAQTDRPPEDVTTANWKALSFYARALQFRAKRDFDQAEQNLKDALAEDENFSSASRELADMLVQAHRYRDGFNQWIKAMALIDRAKVTSRERFSAETLYYGDVFELPRALEVAHAWTMHYPNDAAASFHYGSYLATLGRYEEAVVAMERAWRLEPTPPVARWLAVIGWFREDRAQTDAALMRLTSLGAVGQYLRTRGQTEFLRGEQDAAENTFRELSRLPDPAQSDFGYAFLTCALAEAKKMDEALQASSEHIAALRRTANTHTLARRLLQRAFLFVVSGSIAGAPPLVDESARLEDGPRHLIRLATMYRILGDRRRLEGLIAAGAGWPPINIYNVTRGWAEAELAVLRGALNEARPKFERLIQVSPSVLLPRRLTFGAGVIPAGIPDKLERTTIWYAADHHWPGLIRLSSTNQAV